MQRKKQAPRRFPAAEAAAVKMEKQIFNIIGMGRRKISYDTAVEVISLRWKRWQMLMICIAIPLAVGGLSAWLSRGSMDTFAALNKPPLSPPGWLFPVVWTLLFILMGIASYLVLLSPQPRQTVGRALRVYGIQLAVNFFWSIFFFNLSLYGFSLLWLVFLWVLVLITTVRFYRISPTAGYLMLPYLAWITFAAYLNWGIVRLN